MDNTDIGVNNTENYIKNGRTNSTTKGREETIKEDRKGEDTVWE